MKSTTNSCSESPHKKLRARRLCGGRGRSPKQRGREVVAIVMVIVIVQQRGRVVIVIVIVIVIVLYDMTRGRGINYMIINYIN